LSAPRATNTDSPRVIELNLARSVLGIEHGAD
jgi:hypothetical protein